MQMQDGRPRIGVIGCGYWGKNHVRTWHDLGNLAAVCDVTDAGGTLARQLVPDTPLFERVEDLLERGRCDGVVIATPAETHVPMAQQALRAGLHVLVEKPLALKVADGRQLVRLAAERRKVLMVGHLLEYHPAILRLREKIAAGEFGDLRYLYSNRLNLGKIRREENVLWSFAPHDIAIVLRLAGRPLVEVTATAGNYVQPHLADVAVADLLFDNGMRAHIFVSWLNPFKEQRLVVVGSKKSACFDDVRKELTLYDQHVTMENGVPTSVSKGVENISYEGAEPLRAECEAFADAIVTGKPPLADGRSAVAVLEVLCAAQHSLESNGRPIHP